MSRRDDIQNILVEIEDYTSEMIQDAAFTLHGKLVADPTEGGTPIDTSYASNKWWFAVGRLPARTADNAPLTTAVRGESSVLTYMLGDGPLFVFNDTDYIEYLNNGSSQQAPAMFVEKATDDMVREINQKYRNNTRVL